MEQQVKKGRGGVRPGSGRKKLTEEQKFAKQDMFKQIIIDELIFPAVCTAFHADPGKWQERILTFELSASQVREAYGKEGLKEWKTYFTEVRKGGCDRFGNGYQTMWRFNIGKYMFIVQLVRALGHDIKDMPKPGFPPNAMIARLKAIEERRAARKSKSLNSNADAK